MLYQSHTESLVNQNKIFIELSWWRAHLALIMPLTSMNMLTNMTHMQYQDDAMLTLSWKFDESKWNPYLVIVLMSSSDTNYVLTSMKVLTNMAHLQYNPS